MRLEAFETLARGEFDAVPDRFREGVGGPLVERKAKLHPYIDDFYTLGECVPAPGAEILERVSLERDDRSLVILYYGSFIALAGMDAGFDIPSEVRETIRHEIRHHIEDRAGSKLLRHEDEAEEQNERRLQGLPFAPRYWRLGERPGPGLWRVHADLFLEIELDPRALSRAREKGLRIRWHGRTLRVPPSELPGPGELLTFEGEGEEHGGEAGDLVIELKPR